MQLYQKKPSAADLKRIGILTAQHFKNVQREEVLSAKEAWQSFKAQECAKLMKEEHLIGILDVLRGERTLTFELIRVMAYEYGRCPVMSAFRTMSDLPIKSEYSQLVHKAELYLAHLASQQNKLFEMSVVDG